MLKSSHENIIIKHKLGKKKGVLHIRSGILVRFTNFIYTKNQQTTTLCKVNKTQGQYQLLH